MSQQLISLSPDLKRLQDEGYSFKIESGFLIVNDIQYVNNKREIKDGKLVSALDLSGNRTSPPKSHALYFVGETPCDKEGKPLTAIINNSTPKVLASGVHVDHYLSSKPKIEKKYSDYHHKISTYANLITAPAKSINPELTERLYRTVAYKDDEYFHYHDTNSSRAEIATISDKVKNLKVGIIGLGGTGSYVLDLVAKSPLKEIRLYDGDVFLQHNAFRAPGATDIEILNRREMKVNYLNEIYSKMNKRINPYPENIDERNIGTLSDLDFVFLCIDKTEPKRRIIKFCLENRIQFVDLGIGAEIVDDSILSQIRTTTWFNDDDRHLNKYIPMEEVLDNDLYKSNIQIAELNALNAALAVIRWKKIFGIYTDQNMDKNSLYCINTNRIHNYE